MKKLSFDQWLRNKVLNEPGMSYDRDMQWDQIARKIGKRKTDRKPMLWLFLLVGVIIGSAGIFFNFRKNESSNFKNSKVEHLQQEIVSVVDIGPDQEDDAILNENKTKQTLTPPISEIIQGYESNEPARTNKPGIFERIKNNETIIAPEVVNNAPSSSMNVIIGVMSADDSKSKASTSIIDNSVFGTGNLTESNNVENESTNSKKIFNEQKSISNAVKLPEIKKIIFNEAIVSQELNNSIAAGNQTTLIEDKLDELQLDSNNDKEELGNAPPVIKKEKTHLPILICSSISAAKLIQTWHTKTPLNQRRSNFESALDQYGIAVSLGTQLSRRVNVFSGLKYDISTIRFGQQATEIKYVTKTGETTSVTTNQNLQKVYDTSTVILKQTNIINRNIYNTRTQISLPIVMQYHSMLSKRIELMSTIGIGIPVYSRYRGLVLQSDKDSETLAAYANVFKNNSITCSATASMGVAVHVYRNMMWQLSVSGSREFVVVKSSESVNQELLHTIGLSSGLQFKF